METQFPFLLNGSSIFQMSVIHLLDIFAIPLHICLWHIYAIIISCLLIILKYIRFSWANYMYPEDKKIASCSYNSSMWFFV